MKRFLAGMMAGAALVGAPLMAERPEVEQMPGWVVSKGGAVICTAILVYHEHKTIRCMA